MEKCHQTNLILFEDGKLELLDISDAEEKKRRRNEARNMSPTSRKIYLMTIDDYLSGTATDHNRTAAVTLLDGLRTEAASAGITRHEADAISTRITRLENHLSIVDIAKKFFEQLLPFPPKPSESQDTKCSLSG